MKALGLILFETVEESQGYAYIGDDLGNLPDDRVLEIARVALEHTNRSASLLRKFIRKYGGDK